MSSENPFGADNQQETVRSTLELDPRWVTGFVDGEGCFSVSFGIQFYRVVCGCDGEDISHGVLASSFGLGTGRESIEN